MLNNHSTGVCALCMRINKAFHYNCCTQLELVKAYTNAISEPTKPMQSNKLQATYGCRCLLIAVALIVFHMCVDVYFSCFLAFLLLHIYRKRLKQNSEARQL